MDDVFGAYYQAKAVLMGLLGKKGRLIPGDLVAGMLPVEFPTEAQRRAVLCEAFNVHTDAILATAIELQRARVKATAAEVMRNTDVIAKDAEEVLGS